MNNLRVKPFASAVGSLFAVVFVICFLWGFLIQEAGLNALHLDLMRLSFLGFTGFNALSFILGLIQSYVWGILAAFGLYHCYGFCDKHFFK